MRLAGQHIGVALGLMAWAAVLIVKAVVALVVWVGLP